MEFMPNRSEIKNKLNSSLISLQQYEIDFDFNPNTEFEKWASVEVANFNNIPSGMETFVLPSGLYAVFDYKGLNTDHSIFQYIFGTWLPSSAFVLDNRPHFEVLGDKYKNNDPSSEEEIWIPIRKKQETPDTNFWYKLTEKKLDIPIVLWFGFLRPQNQRRN